MLFILCFVSFSSHAIDTWGILNSFDLDQVQKELKVKENKEIKEKEIKKTERKSLDTYLDTEDDYQIQQEVIKKPFIQEIERPAKVSDELQNLDL